MENKELKADIGPASFGLVMSGLASTSPGLYFFMKYWHVIIITFLLVLCGVLGFGAWKYHEYMNEKLVAVNVELAQYKDQSTLLSDNITKIREDIRIADEQRKKFETDLAEIRRANAELRSRIAGLAGRIPPGTSPADAQIAVDEIRSDINQKWINIQRPTNEE